MVPPSIPLPQKLGIKPGYTVCVINAPEGYMETLGALIVQARLVKALEEDMDIIHVFVTQKTDLETAFPKLKKLLGLQHALWVSWPKGNSGIETNLKEGAVREIGLHNGLVDVKSCAIDEQWFGLKFAYRSKDRIS